MKLFYSELAPWWPLISPVEEYREEALEILRVLRRAHPGARSLLELGSGGGHVASYLKNEFATLTLTDTSAEMLEVSRVLNPECEHLTADMRTLRSGRRFDVVLAHDAIDYMTTQADLARALATAYEHCNPGGVALFVPDAVRESFEPGTDCGGSDADDGRAIRYLEWCYDLDPADDVGTTEYVFIVREADGSRRTLSETHTFGLFAQDTWLRLLAEQGFSPEVVVEQTTDERTPRRLFLGRRAE